MFEKMWISLIVILVIYGGVAFIRRYSDCNDKGGRLVRPLVGLQYECIDTKK